MTSKNWDKSLIDYLKEIPDERDPHGRRHPLWLILLIMIMAIMSYIEAGQTWTAFGNGSIFIQHLGVVIRLSKFV